MSIHTRLKKAIVLYADSYSCADMYYFGKVFVPDPFIAMGVGTKKIAVVSALEYSRVKKESDFDVVLSLEEYSLLANKEFGGRENIVSQIIMLLGQEFDVGKFTVPSDFPAEIALDLSAAGINITATSGPFFVKREIKDAQEAKHIAQGNKASAVGIKAAEEALKLSSVKGGKLYLKGKPLTSERLRSIVDIACLELGAVASNTIVAGGDQACDPHCIGSGPLKANELIIVDVFPRVTKTGYYGDMTRTFLKGTPSPEQKRLVKTVCEAQKIALSKIKAGVNATSVHNAVKAYFDDQGYLTTSENGTHKGFFHGTGHGLGLDLHETPRVSSKKLILKKGSVITVEPGLYYPGLGGCRIEDVVWVNENGYEMLSKCHYSWHIK